MNLFERIVKASKKFERIVKASKNYNPDDFMGLC